MNILLPLLAAGGLIISMYFTLVHRNMIRPDSKWIPAFCRLDESSCGSILRAPEARLLRIPNFYLGIAYYCLLIALATAPALLREFLFEIRIIAGFTVFVGIVLTYSLIRTIRISCVLCFAGHTINLLLFIFLLVMP